MRPLNAVVAACPPSGIGPSGQGHVRCCYATALPQLEEALTRMDRFLGKLAPRRS